MCVSGWVEGRGGIGGDLRLPSPVCKGKKDLEL